MRYFNPWRRSGRTASASSQPPFPAPPEVRMAWIGGGTAIAGAVAFPEDGWRDLTQFLPQVLAGSSAALVRAGELAIAEGLALASLDRAVFALTAVRERPLTLEQRDLLWRAFAVPAFEQYVDGVGCILAGECEAHDGWHLRDPSVEFTLEDGQLVLRERGMPAASLYTGLSAEPLAETCGCGDPAPVFRRIRVFNPAADLAHGALA